MVEVASHDAELGPQAAVQTGVRSKTSFRTENTGSSASVP